MVPKEYGGGILVVFMIGLSKYFDLILGNNNAIIFNTKYYRAVLFLGVILVFNGWFEYDFHPYLRYFRFSFCDFIINYVVQFG
jgi:hypothetical protein